MFLVRIKSHIRSKQIQSIEPLFPDRSIYSYRVNTVHNLFTNRLTACPIDYHIIVVRQILQTHL